ncbi:UDP-glucose 4-epimerase family protein [sulfur-oxidizing endosymbiont of Gigantopelta aegis]|uniref:UDP-glucose 4-epimerase family protein n=1 Tax=sulfur-oxidizing endosymbiont of Gigantopelta aegis TaxID=2794934 RepID=UPI0018DD76CE|nr:SDR family oxidoreductase [sulfur-oxidizing endosymbiont of Gigantopelta aegis]
MLKVLITGSNGFVGQSLASSLVEEPMALIKTYRHLPESPGYHSESTEDMVRCFAVGDINAQTQWQAALSGVDAVVHLAARVHVMQETHADPLAAFREVNTQGTLNLARQAVDAGVKRFIYLSSIKVNGEKTADKPFFADDVPAPQDPYAISKFEAEQQLLQLGKETGLEIVIIRPTLVYGRGVKGNFRRLINLVNKSLPLPFSGIKNARSLVSIDNLCSLIQVCLSHPKAADEVFLVNDGQDVSTTELFETIATVLHVKSRLFYLPRGWIRFFAALLHKNAEFERLFGSLQVDISKNEQLLGWKPGLSVKDGIKKMLESR